MLSNVDEVVEIAESRLEEKGGDNGETDDGMIFVDLYESD